MKPLDVILYPKWTGGAGGCDLNLGRPKSHSATIIIRITVKLRIYRPPWQKVLYFLRELFPSRPCFSKAVSLGTQVETIVNTKLKKDIASSMYSCVYPLHLTFQVL